MPTLLGRRGRFIIRRALPFFFFVDGDLFDAPLVSAALELAFEPSIDDSPSEFLADQIGRQAQHVRIVVSTRHFCGEFIVAQCCSNPSHFVGGDRHADATAAQQDARLRHARDDRFACWIGRVRVITTRRALRSKVEHFVALGGEHDLDLLFSFVPPMIGADCDFQCKTSSRRRRNARSICCAHAEYSCFVPPIGSSISSSSSTTDTRCSTLPAIARTL